MGKFNDDTCFLFANPSFLSGMAAVMDIGGGLLIYNSSRTGLEADERAIASDWAIVGSDILNAAKALGEKAESKEATK